MLEREDFILFLLDGGLCWVFFLFAYFFADNVALKEEIKDQYLLSFSQEHIS